MADENEVRIVHSAGRRKDPATCPVSEDLKCTRSECGAAELECGYGYAGGYGLGGYQICLKCGTVYNFFEDPGV